MRQDFAESLIDSSRPRFASQTAAKFCLNHRKHSFDI